MNPVWIFNFSIKKKKPSGNPREICSHPIITHINTRARFISWLEPCDEIHSCWSTCAPVCNVMIMLMYDKDVCLCGELQFILEMSKRLYKVIKRIYDCFTPWCDYRENDSFLAHIWRQRHVTILSQTTILNISVQKTNAEQTSTDRDICERLSSGYSQYSTFTKRNSQCNTHIEI